ncbi:hypothetical protein PHYBOEH_005642 [Phytophthora boehmeriae]|uniref:RxLR effector protein n=1 Tax=Phytophthora boehmeriae TaxID=109152 RepID=A0A8T1WLE7_9STRA|nr:hypothetical protein PHYBOEH_005642 [Phytophthora boehmeriae]
MRLSFVPFAAMVIAYFVSCDATVDSDQAKISIMASQNLVNSLKSDDAVVRRSLRQHIHHKHHEEFETEERGGGFPGASNLKSLLGGSSKAAKQAAKQAAQDKAEVKRWAKAVMANPQNMGTFEDAHQALGKYSLRDIQKYLGIDDNDNTFLEFYNTIAYTRFID